MITFCRTRILNYHYFSFDTIMTKKNKLSFTSRHILGSTLNSGNVIEEGNVFAKTLSRAHKRTVTKHWYQVMNKGASSCK